MPQIWVSDEELAAATAGDALTVRARAIALGWPRRRCSDGVSRSKLPPDMAEAFVRHWLAAMDPTPTVTATLQAAVATLVLSRDMRADGRERDAA